jgi:hypothetical protein
MDSEEAEHTENEESNESNEDNEHTPSDDILSLYLNNFSEDDEDDTDFVEPTNVEANETENEEEEDKMGDVEFDIEEMSALQKDLQDILAEGEADVYTQFLGTLNEENENGMLGEEDSTDIDYNYQQTQEPNEEYRSDPGVRISGTNIKKTIFNDQCRKRSGFINKRRTWRTSATSSSSWKKTIFTWHHSCKYKLYTYYAQRDTNHDTTCST